MRFLAYLALFLLGASNGFCGPIALDALDSDSRAWFYNRQGVEMKDIDSDIEYCADFANELANRAKSVPTKKKKLATFVLAEMQFAGWPRVFTDDCMVSLGYRRFDVPGQSLADFGRKLQAMSVKDQVELFSAETPAIGKLARTWDNSVWLNSASNELDPSRKPVRPTIVVPPSRWIYGSEAMPTALKADEAIVLVDVKRIVQAGGGKAGKLGPSGIAAVVFRHLDSESRPLDVGLVAFLKSKRIPFADEDQTTEVTHLAFVVAAGTYALQSMSVGTPVQMCNFCLGTIVTTVRPGEVVHFGEFTLRAGGPRKGLSLNVGDPLMRLRVEPPKVDLAIAATKLPMELASRVRIAEWTNNFALPCMSPSFAPIYGFAIPKVTDEGNASRIN